MLKKQERHVKKTQESASTGYIWDDLNIKKKKITGDSNPLSKIPVHESTLMKRKGGERKGRVKGRKFFFTAENQLTTEKEMNDEIRKITIWYPC